jgi:hypothetical protein
MEIIGDDKNIRALFSEAKLADETAAPDFTSVWHRAQSRSLRPRRAFKLSFAAVAALLVLALGSLVVWSFHFQPSETRYEAFASLNAAGNFGQQTINEGPDAVKPITDVTSKHPRVIRHTISKGQTLAAANNRKVTSQPTTIDTWQSPTTALLASPSDNLFKSLPQLNENANEMKSFLPGRSNEKEN